MRWTFLQALFSVMKVSSWDNFDIPSHFYEKKPPRAVTKSWAEHVSEANQMLISEHISI